MLSEKQRSALELGRRIARTKSRPGAPIANAQPVRRYGILADSRYRVLGGHRTGVIHFHV